MITWPIFVALILAVIAVYFSIQIEEKKANEGEIEKEKSYLKKKDLAKRKERLKQK